MLVKKNQTTITAEPGKQELFITREFDAPRELVFKAHTDPELYIQWLGPLGYEMKLETFEPYSGGRYRYIHKDQDGNEYGFHGVFHEISEEMMIQTFEFEGLPDKGHVSLDTMRTREAARRQNQDHDSICLPICCRPGRHGSIRDGARPQRRARAPRRTFGKAGKIAHPSVRLAGEVRRIQLVLQPGSRVERRKLTWEKLLSI